MNCVHIGRKRKEKGKKTSEGAFKWRAGMLLTVAAFQQSENGGLSLFPRLLLTSTPPHLPEGNVSVCMSSYHHKRKVCESVCVCVRARVCVWEGRCSQFMRGNLIYEQHEESVKNTHTHINTHMQTGAHTYECALKHTHTRTHVRAQPSPLPCPFHREVPIHISTLMSIKSPENSIWQVCTCYKNTGKLVDVQAGSNFRAAFFTFIFLPSLRADL